MKKILFALLFVLFFSMALYAEEQQPQQFEGFNLAGYGEGGVKTWDVKGDTADIVGNLVKLSNIVANAYGKDKMNLTADYGTVDKQSGTMHLEKDVVVTTDTGAKLTTDSLDWERSKDLVRTDDPVTITREGVVATGTGATGHPNLKDAQLNKDVTVNMKTEEKDAAGVITGRVVTITCDGPMEMEYMNSRATFNDNVVAIDGERKITADKMEVFFDSGQKKIQEIICTGHVAVLHGENSSYSDKAVYKAAEGKLVLSGRPKLILYTDDKGGISLDGGVSTEKPVAKEDQMEIQVTPPKEAPAEPMELRK